MQAPELTPSREPHRRDPSRLIIAVGITLLLVWLVTFVGGILASDAHLFGGLTLFDFQLVPIFGLALLTLFAGLLLLVRPTAVQQLAQRLAALSSRASSPQEGGAWCLYASAGFLVTGFLLLFLLSGHRLAGIGGWLVIMSLILCSVLARELALRHFRRR